MDRKGDDIDDDLLAAAQAAARENEKLTAQVRNMIEKRDADLVDFEVQLGRALRKGQRHEGARELRAVLQKHAAQGAQVAIDSLDRLADGDPWWSERT